MENNHSIQLLLLLLLTTTNATPFPQLPMQEEMNNIMDAIIGAGDTTVNNWVSIISMSNPSLSLTLFIPSQSSVQDPLLFPYHVVPQRLTFSDLLLFPLNSRLPTLLPGKSIAITDNSASNFSLDDTLLTHPDLYSTPSLAVHGVNALLDYSLFGEPLPPSPPIDTAWSSAAASSFASLTLFFLSLVLQQLRFV